MWGYLVSAAIGFLASKFYMDNKESVRKENEALEIFNNRKQEYIYSFSKKLTEDFFK